MGAISEFLASRRISFHCRINNLRVAPAFKMQAVAFILQALRVLSRGGTKVRPNRLNPSLAMQLVAASTPLLRKDVQDLAPMHTLEAICW